MKRNEKVYYDGDDADRFLAKGKELYEQGDKAELLYCLEWCLDHDKPVPDWLRMAFINAYWAGRGHAIKSWDEVFGRPLEEGKQQKAASHRANIAFLIWTEIELYREQGKSIEELFETVGKEYGVSASVAREIYYEEKNTVYREEDIINRNYFQKD